jgi:trans-2,3-dihydro-3-hydroxyanthranilate isomerase
MKKHLYYLTDVFTNAMFGGNQLAVFPNAELINPQLYQKIAKELNLSETTFVLPSENNDADFKLRIFTPAQELLMAGHPTIGTAAVVKYIGRISPTKNKIIIEEGVGNITVEYQEPNRSNIIWMEQPLPHFGESFTNREEMAKVLSLEPSDIVETLPMQMVTTGVPYLYVPIKNLKAIKSIKVRSDLLESILKDFTAKNILAFTFETETPKAKIHSRMFAPYLGVAEDPATGSAAGPLGAYVMQHLNFASGEEIIVEQGFEMGRPSILHIIISKVNNSITQVKVGGESVLTGEGYLYL